MNIVGTWQRTTNTNCSEKYPEKLEFKANGIYYGEASPGSILHPVWDVGTFRLAAQSVSISVSNDEVIAYDISLQDDILSFKDAEGCLIEYERH